MSGFIILLERSIRIGDRVSIENRVGYISQITARYTVLKGSTARRRWCQTTR